MRTAFASFLLWAGALALLGFVVLMCAIGSRIAAELPPVRRVALPIVTLPQSPPRYCPTPMPVRPQQPKETQV